MPRSNMFKTKEEYNLWMRNYRKKNSEKLRKYHREYNKKRRKLGLYKYTYKEWVKNNPEKRRAEDLLHYTIKIKIIKRLPCIECGNKKSQGHHFDYKKPLEVIWLCALHHKEIHKQGCA